MECNLAWLKTLDTCLSNTQLYIWLAHVQVKLGLHILNINNNVLLMFE